MEDIPLSLPVEQVGALALAIPAIALVLIQMLKAAFYRLAPARWQKALPDRPVWIGLAFVFCVGTSLALKMDIPEHVFGEDWPASFPWYVSAAASGVLLGVAQVKILYPLAVKPQQTRKAAEAVDAACGPPAEQHWAETPEVPADAPLKPQDESEPVTPSLPTPQPAAGLSVPPPWYIAQRLDSWIVQSEAPRFYVLKAAADTEVIPLV